MNRTLLKIINMKKWLQYFIVFLLAFTLAGCGAQEDSAEKAANASELSGSADELSEEAADKTTKATSEEIQEENAPQQDELQEDSDEPDILIEDGEALPEDGTYTSKEDVALYIHLYGHLPSNFITKKDAQSLGWEGGSLEPYAPGKCIGGSYFGNYEGILPEKDGRSYTECDIDTLGADKRGARRIVFSNDGLIYYTEDHYESFELLYGDE